MSSVSKAPIIRAPTATGIVCCGGLAVTAGASGAVCCVRLLEPPGQDVFIFRQCQPEDDVHGLCDADPRCRGVKDAIVLPCGLDLVLAGRDGHLSIFDGLARLKAVERDGQPVFARQHPYELVVGCHRHNARGYGQIQWRRLVVIVAFVTRGRVSSPEWCNGECCDERGTQHPTPRRAHSADGLRPMCVRHGISHILSSQRQTSGCPAAGRAKGRIRARGSEAEAGAGAERPA
jgi:hypothetical protein